MRLPSACAVFVVVMVSGCADDGATSASTQATTVATVAATTTSTIAVDDGQQELDGAWEEIGIDRSIAPAEVLLLDGATFCGWEEAGLGFGEARLPNLEGRRCFVDAHLAGTPALFVVSALDNEGAPLVGAFRTEATSVTLFVDPTRGLGADEWQIDVCASLVIQTRHESDGVRADFRCAMPDEDAMVIG